MIRDPRTEREVEVLKRRYLTPAGTGINVAVTATAASKAITFLRTEPDAVYGVHVTTNWGTTVYVTNKATTGFTANFGTVAPANAKIDWSVFRQET